MILFTLLWANYPHFHYEKLNIKKSDYRFKRYVLPQTQSIITDFERIFSPGNLFRENNNILSIFNNTLLLKREILQKDNLKNIKNKQLFTVQLSKIINQLDRLRSKIKSDQKNYDHYLLFITHLQSATHTAQRLHQYYLKNNLNYHPLLDQLITYLRAAILTALPHPQEIYASLFNNFIYPLHTLVNMTADENYLLQNLGTLNISWHIFGEKITRKSIESTSTTQNITNRISNRWTNILKIYLRNSSF